MPAMKNSRQLFFFASLSMKNARFFIVYRCGGFCELRALAPTLCAPSACPRLRSSKVYFPRRMSSENTGFVETKKLSVWRAFLVKSEE